MEIFEAIENWERRENKMLLQIKQIQLVLFSPGIIISDKAKLVVKINEELQTLFNGDQVVPFCFITRPSKWYPFILSFTTLNPFVKIYINTGYKSNLFGI